MGHSVACAINEWMEVTMNNFKAEMPTVRFNAVRLIHEAIREFVDELISITIQAIDGGLEPLGEGPF
jgi:hypothetical protein